MKRLLFIVVMLVVVGTVFAILYRLAGWGKGVTNGTCSEKHLIKVVVVTAIITVTLLILLVCACS